MRKTILIILFCLISLSAAVAHAQQSVVEEKSISAGEDKLALKPSHWSLEFKTGFWMPTSSALDKFFSPCCNMLTRIEASYLIHRRYGIEFGTGFLYKSGTALGELSGEQSQDKYTFLIIPFDLSFALRADYFTWRYLIPYAKAGVDGDFFHESVAGSSTNGMKFGVHGVGGMQINIGKIGDIVGMLDDIGIRDFFVTLEAKYQWINNFGKKGLDLSGPVYSIGFMFEF